MDVATKVLADNLASLLNRSVDLRAQQDDEAVVVSRKVNRARRCRGACALCCCIASLIHDWAAMMGRLLDPPCAGVKSASKARPTQALFFTGLQAGGISSVDLGGHLPDNGWQINHVVVPGTKEVICGGAGEYVKTFRNQHLSKIDLCDILVTSDNFFKN